MFCDGSNDRSDGITAGESDQSLIVRAKEAVKWCKTTEEYWLHFVSEQIQFH